MVEKTNGIYSFVLKTADKITFERLNIIVEGGNRKILKKTKIFSTVFDVAVENSIYKAKKDKIVFHRFII